MGLIFKYQMTPMLFKHFQAREKRKKNSNTFYEGRLILIPKPDTIYIF